MEEERSIDRLARYIIYLAAAAIICGICWYFKSVIIYIVLAAVVALIGKPIIAFGRKLHIGGKRIPSWILAVLTIIIIFSLLLIIVTQIIPVVSSIVQSITTNVQAKALDASPKSFTDFLDRVNYNLQVLFPSLGYDFKIENYAIDYIKNTFSISSGISSVSNVIGSVASIVADLGIALFSVVFISFFFLKDESLFKKIIAALSPKKHEEQAKKAIGRIEHLLSRYFIGLIIEVAGVATINFLGLWTIGNLSFYNAFGIAFIAGLLNVIPYVGPLTGGVIGTILGMSLKISYALSIGAPIHFWAWAATLIAIFVFTQLIDNFIFQPFIYSTSIKSSPLEIFIVLLMAGHIGGIVGMLVAIPSYTVIRVIASEFFYDVKFIQRLIPDKEEETNEIEGLTIYNTEKENED